MPSCRKHPASKWFGYCVEGMKLLCIYMNLILRQGGVTIQAEWIE